MLENPQKATTNCALHEANTQEKTMHKHAKKYRKCDKLNDRLFALMQSRGTVTQPHDCT
jgi:hypothetical protein